MPPSDRRRLVVRVSSELALLGALFLVYRWGRLLIADHERVAVANAYWLRDAQRWLRLPDEARLQTLVDSTALFHLANVYYVSMHFPMAILFLVVGLLARPRPVYTWARNLLVTQTGLALGIHLVVPLAPPRMFPDLGFVDTMEAYGPSAYDGLAASVANQYAAMPSLHVGWSVLIWVVVTRTGPRWVAVTAGLHACATAAVVLVTANHWWLDGVVAVALLGLALLIVPTPEPVRVRRPPGSLQRSGGWAQMRSQPSDRG